MKFILMLKMVTMKEIGYGKGKLNMKRVNCHRFDVFEQKLDNFL